MNPLMIPIAETTAVMKKRMRWPNLSMAGPAAKHPTNFPIKAREDRSEVCRESIAYTRVFALYEPNCLMKPYEYIPRK